MGAVKGYIDDLTYAIIKRCNIEDDDEGKNHDDIFQWVMEQDFVHQTEDEIITLYKREKGI